MKSLKIAVAAAGLVLVASPVAAQLVGNDGQDFVDAVKKRDGDKATDLIDKHPTIVDTKNGDGDTGLIIAIRGDDSDWTGFLLRKGADPNLQGSQGDTPLITAAKSSFEEAVPWLLGLGAKIDGTNKNGETALIIAVQQRDPKMVKLLLDAGADPDKTDTIAGYSARDYATRDTRARDILQMINNKKPKSGAVAAK